MTPENTSPPYQSSHKLRSSDGTQKSHSARGTNHPDLPETVPVLAVKVTNHRTPQAWANQDGWSTAALSAPKDFPYPVT